MIDSLAGGIPTRDSIETYMSILHLDHNATETASSYNEHILPNLEQYELTLCTLFDQVVSNVPSGLTLQTGDNSTVGFIKQLFRILRTKKIDIIHVHTPHTAVLLAITSLLMLKPGLLRISVFTAHNSFGNWKARNQLLAFIAFLFMGHIVHCSKSSYDSLPLLYRLVSDRKRTYIQNGVDLVRIDRTLATNLPVLAKQNEFQIVSVGRLIHIKNPFALIHAYIQSQIDKSKLVFIGQGDLSTQLENEINAKARNSDIELLGLIPRDHVFNHFQASELFISTSYGEGLPYSVMEAMACRCPVILSDIPPHREIAQDTDFIPLVHPDDVHSLSQEIHKMASASAEERESIGEKCREWVEQHFSLASMNQKYAELYQEIYKSTTKKLLNPKMR